MGNLGSNKTEEATANNIKLVYKLGKYCPLGKTQNWGLMSW